MFYFTSLCIISCLFGRSMTLDDKEIAALTALKNTIVAADIRETFFPGKPDCKTWQPYLVCYDGAELNGHARFLHIGCKKPMLNGSMSDVQRVCDLKYLESLRLYGQQYHRLKGPIPECIGNFKNLNYLDISGNCFTGEIPPSIGNLNKVTYMSLSGKTDVDLCPGTFGFTGSVPPSLGNMFGMKYFYISGHPHLSGSIPETFGNLVSVKSLYMNSNNLTGEIPKTLGMLQNLDDLQFNRNKLTGQIPKELSYCSSLKVLQLNSNNLTGEIPVEIGTLPQLHSLSVVDNHLSGPVLTFQDTPVLALNALDIRQNNFSGEIPESIADGPMKYLLVNNNPLLRSNDSTSLPSFIDINYSRTSVNDHAKNYSCPSYSLHSHAFDGTNPIVQMDPTYYNYTKCYCMNGYFGLPPNKCYACLAKGTCNAKDLEKPELFGSMSFGHGYFPVSKDGLDTIESVAGLEPCIWNEKKNKSACNPNGDCYYGREGLAGKGPSGKCQLCEEGYSHRLCSYCDCSVGVNSSCYYRFHDECIKCRHANPYVLLGYGIGAVIVLMFYAWFYENTLARTCLVFVMFVIILTLGSGSWFELNLLIISLIIVPVTYDGLSSGLIKSLIFFLQTESVIAASAFPNWWTTIAGKLQFVNLRFVGLVCLFPEQLGASSDSTLHGTILSLCAPIVVFIAICIFLAIKGCMHRRQMGWKKISYQIRFSIIFILYFSFFNASTVIISIFNCVQDASGNYYLEPHPWLECKGPEYDKLTILAIVGGIVFIAIPPVAFSILLFRYSDRLYTRQVKPWLGYLYICYRPEETANMAMVTLSYKQKLWCFAEILFMLLRFILAVCISIPHNSSIWKNVYIIMALLVILSAYFFLKPYSRRAENILACVSIMVLILSFIASIQLNAMWTDRTYIRDNKEETALRCFVFVINAALVIAFSIGIIHQTKRELTRNWRAVKRKARNLWRTIRHKINRRNTTDIDDNGSDSDYSILGTEDESDPLNYSGDYDDSFEHQFPRYGSTANANVQQTDYAGDVY